MLDGDVWVLLYPIGTDEEIDFGEIPSVPAVGDRVQGMDRRGMNNERTAMYEVVRREWTSIDRGGAGSRDVQVALHVREVDPSKDESAEAEIVRLREALEKVYQCGTGRHVEIAREALNG